MIAELFATAYDDEGRPTFRPDQQRRRRFPATFPIGRYVTQPLTVQCSTFEELRSFLSKCRYISDQEQFDKPDYWMPPEEFEKSKRGDCADFALYAWRQLIKMGYRARFVAGPYWYPRSAFPNPNRHSRGICAAYVVHFVTLIGILLTSNLCRDRVVPVECCFPIVAPVSDAILRIC